MCPSHDRSTSIDTHWLVDALIDEDPRKQHRARAVLDRSSDFADERGSGAAGSGGRQFTLFTRSPSDMALCHIHWSSDILKKQTSTYVILPDRGSGPFPVFYLLHGLSDDYTIWLRRTRIDVYASWSSMIIVMPDGGRGFYTNNYQGPRWADHLALELPEFIERTFPARKDRAGRCIGGLSMGGYGAMRLGLGHADRYASINSHSGALRTLSATRDVLPPDEFGRIFGPIIDGTENDLLHLAKTAQATGDLPPLRIDCGTEDFLLDENRLMHRQLVDAGIPHQYEEFPGYHNWDYWEIHIQEALRFHARNLGLAK